MLRNEEQRSEPGWIGGLSDRVTHSRPLTFPPRFRAGARRRSGGAEARRYGCGAGAPRRSGGTQRMTAGAPGGALRTRAGLNHLESHGAAAEGGRNRGGVERIDTHLIGPRSIAAICSMISPSCD